MSVNLRFQFEGRPVRAQVDDEGQPWLNTRDVCVALGLLEIILRKQTKRLVLTHKDRLLRFGAELVFALCELQGIEIVIIHKGEQPTFEQELAEDILEIITVFSARLYGARSKKNRKLMETLQAEADRIGEEFGVYDAARPQD